MKASIRREILIPVLSVQAVAVAILAIMAAVVAARKAEAQVVERLDAVIATLERSTFPLTTAVLQSMRGLSGAHFVALSADGTVRESTLAMPSGAIPSITALPDRVRLDAGGRSAILVLAGTRYLAASVRSAGGFDRPRLLVLYPEAAWLQARWDAAMPPLAVGLLALVAMAAVTGLIAERLARRVRSLEEKTRAIASGDFRPLDAGTRDDEVTQLARSINRMCEQLQEMKTAIQRTERAGLLAQVAAGLAHSLRNAATGARMAVQLHTRRCPLGPDDASLVVALRQLSLGEEQVQGLLALGRPKPANRQEVTASAIVADVASLVEPACRHARVEFSSIAEESLSLVADVENLRAAVLNLTLNAIEAAGPGGSVALLACRHDDHARFDVVDSGPGPPDHLAESLFDPFVTTRPEGVGLGLAVVKRVATDHGGTTSWSRFGGQTRFRISLPQEASTRSSRSPEIPER